MKKLILLLFLTSFIFSSLGLGINNVDAYVSVKGYYKSNGTYVAPHVRSNPNGLKYDNYGYTPNQGLYNPTYGTRGTTWDTPTYITDPNYYLGKSLYEQNKTSYSIPSYTTVLPKKDVSYVTKLWVGNNPTTSCEQSTFLRSKEKIECSTYKSLMNNYTWNVTTNEYDGMHYRYDPKTQTSYSCPDGSTILYDTATGKPTQSCTPEISTTSLPIGCTTKMGFSTTNGLSCSSNTCAFGLAWNGNMCTPN